MFVNQRPASISVLSIPNVKIKAIKQLNMRCFRLIYVIGFNINQTRHKVRGCNTLAGISTLISCVQLHLGRVNSQVCGWIFIRLTCQDAMHPTGRVNRGPDLTQIGYSLAGQARFLKCKSTVFVFLCKPKFVTVSEQHNINHCYFLGCQCHIIMIGTTSQVLNLLHLMTKDTAHRPETRIITHSMVRPLGHHLGLILIL